MSERRKPSHMRGADDEVTLDPGAQTVQGDAVRYRRLRRAALLQRRFWSAYIVLATAVVVAAAFGIAGAGNVLPGQQGNRPVQDHAQEEPTAEPAQPAEGEEQEAASSGVEDSARVPDSAEQPLAKQSEAPSQVELDARAADFTVDPARVDWNYDTNGRKTVYLTIDDGPSENTQAVLDILDRYGCKATFFVVGHNDDYFPMIAEAYRRGHTIGLHSMTHDYAWVYSSTDAFYEDLAAIGEVVRNQIGFVPCFIRFPGGSSNLISQDYTEGIMTELTASVQENGYQYYDWNISVGDGAEHTADEIAEYGMADEGDENIMLLCHDSATKQATVEALPRIIEHYQSLGYSFEAIDRQSWVCHHGVSN